jgi:hypothetical protein
LKPRRLFFLLDGYHIFLLDRFVGLQRFLTLPGAHALMIVAGAHPKYYVYCNGSNLDWVRVQFRLVRPLISSHPLGTESAEPGRKVAPL